MKLPRSSSERCRWSTTAWFFNLHVSLFPMRTVSVYYSTMKRKNIPFFITQLINFFFQCVIFSYFNSHNQVVLRYWLFRSKSTFFYDEKRAKKHGNSVSFVHVLPISLFSVFCVPFINCLSEEKTFYRKTFCKPRKRIFEDCVDMRQYNKHRKTRDSDFNSFFVVQQWSSIDQGKGVRSFYR